MVLLIIIPIKWLFHWECTQHFQTNPHVGRWQEEITKQHQKEIYESSQSFAMAQLEEGKGWKWHETKWDSHGIFHDVCDLYRLVCFFVLS